MTHDERQRQVDGQAVENALNDVAELVVALQAPATAAELKGVDQAVALFSTRKPRSRLRLVTATGITSGAVIAVLATGVLAAAAGTAHLPDPVQRLAHRVLHRLGVPKPHSAPKKKAACASCSRRRPADVAINHHEHLSLERSRVDQRGRQLDPATNSPVKALLPPRATSTDSDHDDQRQAANARPVGCSVVLRFAPRGVMTGSTFTRSVQPRRCPPAMWWLKQRTPPGREPISSRQEAHSTTVALQLVAPSRPSKLECRLLAQTAQGRPAVRAVSRLSVRLAATAGAAVKPPARGHPAGAPSARRRQQGPKGAVRLTGRRR